MTQGFSSLRDCERPLPCPPKSQRKGLPYDKPSKPASQMVGKRRTSTDLSPPWNEIRHTERRQKAYKYMRIYLWSALRIMNLRLAETRSRADRGRKTKSGGRGSGIRECGIHISRLVRQLSLSFQHHRTILTIACLALDANPTFAVRHRNRHFR